MTLHDSDVEAAVTGSSASNADAVESPPAPAPAPPAPGRHGGRRASGSSSLEWVQRIARPVSLLVIALVASLVLAGWLGLQVRSDDREAADRREAIAAGQAAATRLTSYDHARLDEDFAAITEKMTEAFRGEYTVTTQVFRQLIADLHAKAIPTILSTGLVSYGDGRAEVLVALDQMITNDNLKVPRQDRSRLRLTLEKHDGRWLVSGAFLV